MTDINKISPYVYPLIKFDNSVDIDHILDKVVNYFNLTKEELKSKKRNPELVDPRIVFCFLALKYSYCSHKEVGELINRDYSTVYYYINKANNKYSIPLKVAKAIEQIKL